MVDLPFTAALALAGSAYLLGHAVVRRLPILERNFLPEPVVGGLLVALGLLLLRAMGITVDHPRQGLPLDVLVGTLTANMGLHVTPSVLRRGLPLFLSFLGLGGVLAVLQFLLAIPVTLPTAQPLHSAFLAAPLALVGAPFNLNPPDQTSPLTQAFAVSYPQVEPIAQGAMMLGVLAGIFVSAAAGRRLEMRAQSSSPTPPKREEQPRHSVSAFAYQLTAVLASVLLAIAGAIALQDALLGVIPGLRNDHLPIILLSYLLAAVARLAFERIRPDRFPERALTTLLLGPTMGIVFAYAVMSLPLQHLGLVSLPLALATLLGVAASAGVGWLGFSLFARLTNRYYAAVIATAFIAVTTAWGPIGMSFLRFFTREEGEVEPMPVVMPVNAFYLFPWLMIFFGKLILQ